jgi:hypothetical protein
LSFLGELKSIAKRTGVPLVVPELYLEQHGMLDLSIDV